MYSIIKIIFPRLKSSCFLNRKMHNKFCLSQTFCKLYMLNDFSINATKKKVSYKMKSLNAI